MTTNGGAAYLDVVLGKRIAAVSLVDYLGHADHVVVVVADWHAQYQIGRVARHVVDLSVEPRVLHEHIDIRVVRKRFGCNNKNWEGKQKKKKL